MHTAEHRGLRELYVTGRHQCRHWRTLADRLEAAGGAGPAQLRDGSQAARELLAELTLLTAARDLWGKPAAQGLGARVAGVRSALVDPALEVNQALRLALLDVQHVVTLLAYLERLAGQRDDEELRGFLAGYGERMGVHEQALRDVAIGVGDTPAAAVAPCTPGIAGRIGHALGVRIGTVGEWIDRRAGRR